MKLALYGGSFDPPHIGHVTVVREALRVLDIDRLIIVPASRNPFKRSVRAPGNLRYDWLQKIFEAYSNVEISDYESVQERSVFTIETVSHYKQKCDQLYLIIGADNLEKLASWHRFDELNAMVTWVVAKRDAIPIPTDMIALDIDVAISSTDIRNSCSSLGLEETLEQTILTYYKEHP